jgi:hypothetical protein
MIKSKGFISRNMSHAAKEDLSGILGVRHVLDTGTYLGLPSMIGRNKPFFLILRTVYGTLFKIRTHWLPK